MVNYYVKRTAKAIVTIYVVITLSFGLTRMLPGNPASRIRGRLSSIGYTEEQIQVVLSNLGYNPDVPLPQKFIDYIVGLHQGSLGSSIQVAGGGTPVTEIMATRLPWTIMITLVSIVLFFAISITLGAIMAYREGSRFDTANSAIAIFASGIPFFVMAILLVFIFGQTLGWFPTGRRYSLDVTPGFNLAFLHSVIYHGTLPIAAIVISRYGVRALSMRGNSISILGKGYVEVAKLRGLPERVIALRYVGRNAVLPMYTGMLLSFGWVLGGTIVLEDVFNYKGLGWMLFQAYDYRDYPVLMGAFLVITLSLVIGIFLADLSYGFVDPRIKTGDESESF
ncbi:ABC transporter permease protein [Halorhabdus tiamatea SARL4B]|uniref:ABC transporter permease protein n=1 Tax=Halorhabdus tiamatea SARL4B TaxID=1033806 RepID=F7PL54_9EURY|nr:ABC transporter permease [Halorhabdus tiamatea]ERJ05865.1 ABC transporter permease protein [Halorhabdus tiamatea SARL4B]CCQ34455.1 dipeptide/oligopeptide/nickel ABC transporter, permease component [Halorhabdus tiamatea SARL4B]